MSSASISTAPADSGDPARIVDSTRQVLWLSGIALLVLVLIAILALVVTSRDTSSKRPRERGLPTTAVIAIACGAPSAERSSGNCAVSTELSMYSCISLRSPSEEV